MGQFAHLGSIEDFFPISLPIFRGINPDGMQEAHLQGAALFNEDMLDLRVQIDPFGTMPAEMATNGVLAPESKEGSLALRVTVHNGRQQIAFDNLSYEVDNPDGDQFLNGLRRDVQASVGWVKPTSSFFLKIPKS